MWKYRSEAIFAFAMVFAVHTVVAANPVHLIATIVFLACHYLDRFFGADRAEQRIAAKMKQYEDALKTAHKAYEDELKSIKNDVSRIGLTMGIRGGQK